MRSFAFSSGHVCAIWIIPTTHMDTGKILAVTDLVQRTSMDLLFCVFLHLPTNDFESILQIWYLAVAR